MFYLDFTIKAIVKLNTMNTDLHFLYNYHYYD